VWNCDTDIEGCFLFFPVGISFWGYWFWESTAAEVTTVALWLLEPERAVFYSPAVGCMSLEILPFSFIINLSSNFGADPNIFNLS